MITVEDVKRVFEQYLQDLYILEAGGVLDDALEYDKAYKKASLVAESLKDSLIWAKNNGYDVTDTTAEELLRPLLDKDYAICSDIAGYAQKRFNEAINLGVNPIQPQSYGQIDDIVDSAKTVYANGGELDDGISNKVGKMNRAIIADSQKKNTNFLGKSGVQIKVKRVAGKCDLNHTTISKKGKAYHYGDKYAKVCDFCSRMEGTYTYPNISDDVWAFHDGCTCYIEYTNRRGDKEIISR